MPVFRKPTFNFDYDPAAEARRLRHWKRHRGIPDASRNTLLIATWNIANFGAQDRRDSDLRLISEIVRWFDVVAIQETRGDLGNLFSLMGHLPGKYRAVFSDTAGNDERMVYVFDFTKVKAREQVGELALPPSELRFIKLPGVPEKFSGFDRNPFLHSFSTATFNFTLVNVHLYFGSDHGAQLRRRQLETYALARWGKRQARSPKAFDQNVILLGDFNLPYMRDDDPIYAILRRNGLMLTEHSSEIGATLPSESRDRTEMVKQYDQIAFFPNTREFFSSQSGVFDFDSAIFPALWEGRTRSQFNEYVRYYISDHRPLWAELRG